MSKILPKNAPMILSSSRMHSQDSQIRFNILGAAEKAKYLGEMTKDTLTFWEKSAKVEFFMFLFQICQQFYVFSLRKREIYLNTKKLFVNDTKIIKIVDKIDH